MPASILYLKKRTLRCSFFYAGIFRVLVSVLQNVYTWYTLKSFASTPSRIRTCTLMVRSHPVLIPLAYGGKYVSGYDRGRTCVSRVKSPVHNRFATYPYYSEWDSNPCFSLRRATSYPLDDQSMMFRTGLEPAPDG